MILKSSRPIFFLLLVAALAGNSGVRAQIETPEKAEQEAAKQQELRKKTLSLLDDVISAAWSLKLPENRSFVLTNAADLLWPYDEKRARALFWEAFSGLNLTTSAEGNLQAAMDASDSARSGRSNGPTKAQQEDINKYFAKLETRSTFLQKVARHDPQLALEMLRSTRPGPVPHARESKQFDPDAILEQALTYAAVANDPKRALEIAHENLAKGLTYQILNLLTEVNQRDQDAGTQLAGDIIAKLQTENLGTSNFAFMAVSLLHSSRTGGAVLFATHEQENPSPVTRLKLDDHQKQDLVYLLTDAALNASAGDNALQSVQLVMPEIEQYAPDRVAKLKSRLAEYNRTLPPVIRDLTNFSAQFEKASPEEMIRAASKVTDEVRDALFYQAASKAVARGEADRYRELLNSQVADELQRRAALDALDNEQMFYDLSHGQTDDLEKLLPLIRIPEQRAMAMAQLAMLLESQHQHDEAVKLLDGARVLVKINLTNDSQSNALLTVMMAYAVIDPPKAFRLIEPIVDRANDEISKLLLLDRVAKTGAVKNGEILLNQPQIRLDSSMTRYSAGVVALAKSDFDRTRSLADRFQRNELKVAARLMLAQSLLRHFETPQQSKQ